MSTLLGYSFITLLTLALPLYLYKHGVWIIIGACIAEAACIALIYGSTFIICTDKSACGVSWASSAIPLLIMAMNIGMIWPILAGYAKQAQKESNNKNQK